MTPIGFRPTRVPMSAPSLASEYTRAPTISKSGRWSMIVVTISAPTAPVPHGMTRYLGGFASLMIRSAGTWGAYRPSSTRDESTRAKGASQYVLRIESSWVSEQFEARSAPLT